MSTRHIFDVIKVSGVCGFFVLVSVLTAAAQPGGDPLAAICQGFLSSSGAPSPGNATALCGCLVREIQANLSEAEMQSYQSATAAGRALPPAIQDKVMSIATTCLTEAR